MDAPDELRQAVASAVDLCVDGWNGEPWDMALQVADAVLAVPGIADALARDAGVAEEVAAWLADDFATHERMKRIAALYPGGREGRSFTGAEVAAMLRDGDQ